MTTGTGIIEGVSVSHSRASVTHIEAACSDSQRAAAEALLDQPGVSEAFVLQTCNRAEAYVVVEDEDTGREALDLYVEGVDASVVRELDHEASLRHLMRVTCGLESLVIGEDQIIGQVREAYEDARSAGTIGPTLEDAVLKSLHVGERARDETAINDGVVSLGSAAVRLARDERDLADATALVVGAGEMATIAARSLDDHVGRVIVANRTIPHAEHVANELDTDAAAVGLATVPTAVESADLVVTATGSDAPIVDREDLETAGRTLVIDIAQPRDVDPESVEVDDVTVYDLDVIESVTDRTLDDRQRAAEVVESMIDEEFDHLISQYKRKRADQVIAAMYEGAERIKAHELDTALAKLDAETDGGVTDAEREIVESMADALVGQLLSAPTESLRTAAENDDWSTINTALRLFDPGQAADPTGGPSLPDRPESIPEELRERIPAHVLEQLAADDD